MREKSKTLNKTVEKKINIKHKNRETEPLSPLAPDEEDGTPLNPLYQFNLQGDAQLQIVNRVFSIEKSFNFSFLSRHSFVQETPCRPAEKATSLRTAAAVTAPMRTSMWDRWLKSSSRTYPGYFLYRYRIYWII